jgi:uncharacterized FlaG/YvyC family protein
MNNVRNDMPVQQPQFRSERPAKENTAKTSAVNTEQKTPAVSEADKPAIPSIYEQNKQRVALEAEMDKLLKMIMPDLGLSFRVHDSGRIITTVTNNCTQEVVREFPAEKILDLVHEMVQRLGIMTNVKV